MTLYNRRGDSAAGIERRAVEKWKLAAPYGCVVERRLGAVVTPVSRFTAIARRTSNQAITNLHRKSKAQRNLARAVAAILKSPRNHLHIVVMNAGDS